nr:uncharacterized protein LOC129424230 [Misgurnus anguillicaudatus]
MFRELIFYFFLVFQKTYRTQSKMPRGKGFRRSQAAKRRIADRYAVDSSMDLAEVVPPLKKEAHVPYSALLSANKTNLIPKCSNALPILTNTPPICTTTPPKSTKTSPMCTTTPPKSTKTSPMCTTTPPMSTKTNPMCTTTPSMSTKTSPMCTKTSPMCTTTPPMSTKTSPMCTTTPSMSTKTSPMCTITPPMSTKTSPMCTTTPSMSTKTSPMCIINSPRSKKTYSDIVKSFDANNSDQFIQKVIQGSFHQGDAQFSFNRNRQCAVNSIMAIMMSELKNVLTWTTEDLNAVLMKGDELYTCMRLQGKINDDTGRGHVSIVELPTVHTLYNTIFSINRAESFSGVIGVDVYDIDVQDVCMPIDETLQRTMLNDDACLLNIKDYICAVIKAGTTYAVVDSHSRNSKGMVQYNGTSVVVYFDDIYMLFNHVDKLAMSLNAQGTPFEVKGVKASVIGKASIANTSSCESGQQSSVSQVSPKATGCKSKCIKVDGKQICPDKPVTLCKLNQTCGDSSKSKLKADPKVAHVSKLYDNVMDDVIIVETENHVKQRASNRMVIAFIAQ